MRLLLLMFCTVYTSLQATECADRFFIEKHVNLAICKNHARGLEEAALYYSGVAKALDDYIALRIERGELQDKKFEIYMLDPILTRPHIFLTQSKKGYHIMTGRAHTLDELLCMVDEFSKLDFTAIDVIVDSYDEKEYDRQEQQLDKLEKRLFGKQLPQTDIELIKNKEYITHQQNKLKLVYKNDKVKCLIDEVEIQTELKGLPWNIQDRYIFQECGVFKVYQDSALIKTFRYQGNDEWECEYMDYAEVFNKWVNFRLYGYNQYSYSYDKNRFYYTGDKKD
ncbi:hypothetical protein GGR21_000551 [Dysgonomonas hofstadii]|uniref:Uncharacterized protein n=1 Tax=Dysgonomonas hofstadii TaxID=637886 RepID=A0A840CMC9_9BACT|nr:hypothetical protein [Dysgonomonas hofstadii]MBB4034664.1 hypothetical protein [Dysgonomonas hofstadii]